VALAAVLAGVAVALVTLSLGELSGCFVVAESALVVVSIKSIGFTVDSVTFAVVAVDGVDTATDVAVFCTDFVASDLAGVAAAAVFDLGAVCLLAAEIAESKTSANDMPSSSIGGATSNRFALGVAARIGTRGSGSTGFVAVVVCCDAARVVEATDCPSVDGAALIFAEAPNLRSVAADFGVSVDSSVVVGLSVDFRVVDSVAFDGSVGATCAALETGSVEDVDSVGFGAADASLMACAVRLPVVSTSSSTLAEGASLAAGVAVVVCVLV